MNLCQKREKISALAGLCRIRLSLFTALSAVAGFFLAASAPSLSRALSLAAGVLFLSFGASALNQFLEAATDGLMPRTRQRPIPSGRLRPGHALWFAVASALGGVSVILLSGGVLPAALGSAAFLWYGFIYTPLKKKTAFSFVPGALAGAAPPAIGWVMGGGALTSPELLVISFFFYIWQIPHFWLILLRYGGEYERAGLPSVTNIFSRRDLKRIIFVCEVCTALSAMLLAVFVSGTPGSTFTLLFFAVPAAWMIGSGAAILGGNGERSLLAGRSIDVCVLAITCLLAAGRFMAV